MTATIEIRPTITEADCDASADALSKAFYDDPIMRWLVPDDARRAANGPAIFRLFVDAFAHLGETYVVGDGRATALWAPPGGVPVAEEDAERFGAAIVEVMGADAERMDQLMTLLEANHPETPCWHLQLVGVAPEAQGRGIGGRLLEHVLGRADAHGEPAYLEATSELNRRLYERYGFELMKELRIADSPTLYAMWRDPRG